MINIFFKKQKSIELKQMARSRDQKNELLAGQLAKPTYICESDQRLIQ